MEELLASASKDFNIPGLGSIIFRLGLAVFLGCVIAYRPWRRFLGLRSPRLEMVHAQVLIALAGAIAVTVIGDSLARAFGLVGLGGFIRFRTGLRDPRDAAVFFLLIGLGMACGLGAPGVAMICAAFVGAILVVLDVVAPKMERPYLRLTAVCTDPLGASGPIRLALESFPIIIRNTNLKLETKEIRFDIENPKGVEANKLQTAVLDSGNGLVVALTCESLETLKGARI